MSSEMLNYGALAVLALVVWYVLSRPKATPAAPAPQVVTQYVPAPAPVAHPIETLYAASDVAKHAILVDALAKQRAKQDASLLQGAFASIAGEPPKA